MYIAAQTTYDFVLWDGSNAIEVVEAIAAYGNDFFSDENWGDSLTSSVSGGFLTVDHPSALSYVLYCQSGSYVRLTYQKGKASQNPLSILPTVVAAEIDSGYWAV